MAASRNSLCYGKPDEGDFPPLHICCIKRKTFSKCSSRGPLVLVQANMGSLGDRGHKWKVDGLLKQSVVCGLEDLIG